MVRKAANLHTGGTIHDVTEHVHPRLVDAAVRVARAIGIPVVGIDFVVRSPHGAGLCLHRGERAPGARQPRAAADGGALRRPAVSAVGPRGGAQRHGTGASKRMSRLTIDTEYLGQAPGAPPRDTEPHRIHRQHRPRMLRRSWRASAIDYEVTRRGAVRALPAGPRAQGRARLHLASRYAGRAGEAPEAERDGWSSCRSATGRRASPKARAARSSPSSGSFRGTILPLKASGHTFNEGVDTLPVGWDYVELRLDAQVRARRGRARGSASMSATSSPSIRSWNSWTTASSSRATSTTRRAWR